MKTRTMNNALIALGIAALLPAGSALAASGGTVNLNGSVVNTACAISANSANINVDMGEIRAASLAAAGSEANTGATFKITLEDCAVVGSSQDPNAATAVGVTFSGTPDINNPDSLAVGLNGGEATAKNVAIRLYDEAGNEVKLGQMSDPVALRDGTNSLKFSAKYFSPQGGATAGDASAVATYTVTYS